MKDNIFERAAPFLYRRRGRRRDRPPQPADWAIARAVARHRGHGEDWDDCTQEDVTEWLRTADPITYGELAAVFGPWREVTALVRRTAVLTPDEVDRLNAAEFATVATILVAEDAASQIPLDDFLYAAINAVLDVASDAARKPASDAARAIVVRDLIGRYGFEQHHYDALTMPWRKTIGPIHPGDAPVEVEK